MPKKICEICLSPDLGGLELYMARSAGYFGDNCSNVINEKGKLREYFDGMNGHYFTLKRRNVLLSWIGALRLARILDAEEIDVVHVHWTKDLPLVITAKILSKRRPKVVQSRHMRMTRFKDDIYHRFIYKNIDMMLAVTQQVKQQIEKFVPREICPKVEVLYIGAEQPVVIDADERTRRRKELGLDESFVVGIVGRIEEPKGQHIVVEAVRKLVVGGIDAKALIVGHAMDDGYLQKLQNDYADIAIFTGFTREAQTMMQLCDVMVLATDNETFGLVLIEAMMCGVCVVASDSGGPLEIIDDGDTGLLFQTFDSNDLAERLLLLCQDQELRKKMSEAGKIKALKKFEQQQQFMKLQEIMETI